MDPKAEKSRRFSSYAYVEDNPIRNIDPDGMVTIDGADKNVNGGNATYVKNKDGSVTWTNATEDTKRVGDAMLKTDVGTKKLNDMVNSTTKIKIVDDKTSTPENGRQMGVTKASDNGARNFFGELKTATVTVFEKNIQTVMSIGHEPMGVVATDDNVVNMKSYSLEENIGAIATHEATHATDPKFPLFAPAPQAKIDALEKLPWENAREFYKELGDRP